MAATSPWRQWHNRKACREDADAGVSTASAAERNDMETTKAEWSANEQTFGFVSNMGLLFKVSFTIM